MGLRRLVILGLLVPIAGATAICAVASVFPVRLDRRALQDLVALERAGLQIPNQDFIFLSRDNSIESARTATFALRPIAFPSGMVFWATLKERSQGVWGTDFVAVDASGAAYLPLGGAPGSWQWKSFPEAASRVRQALSRVRVVYDDAETQQAFESRWPFLTSAASVTVLSTLGSPPAAGIWRAPNLELRPVRVFRIATVLGVFTMSLFVLLHRIQPGGVAIWLVVGGSVFTALGLVATVGYLFQWVLPGRAHWSTMLLWLTLLVVGFWCSRRGREDFVLPPLPEGRSGRLVLGYALVAYASLFVARLDFDGDFFNNWLPQARFHYLLGQHDPSAVLGYGSIQAASYPPGYGVLLSTLMWTADLRADQSFLSGLDTSFAILMYRLGIFVLNAALLVLVTIYLAHLEPDTHGAWMVAVVACILTIPSLAGRHIAAETVLFPMLAAAIVLIAAGRSFRLPSLTGLGLAVGGMATLLKWEGAILLILGVLPWLVSPPAANDSPGIRTWTSWAAVLTMALVPVVVWKATLVVENQSFGPVTWSGLVASSSLLRPLTVRALQLTLATGAFLLLFIALPSALLSRLASSRGWDVFLVPAGIITLFVSWLAVYVFSNLDPVTHLATSFDRLVMVPTFSAILYCAIALQVGFRKRNLTL